MINYERIKKDCFWMAIDYGKGRIWDIAFSKDDVKKVYNELIE